jgi:hypothetical protein
VGVRERILTIRLMDKVRANPAYAQSLGIVVAKAGIWQTASNSADKKP